MKTKKNKRSETMKLALPERATLELRKPHGAHTYLPVRVRFFDGSTTSKIWNVFESLGVEILDWADPEITDCP